MQVCNALKLDFFDRFITFKPYIIFLALVCSISPLSFVTSLMKVSIKMCLIVHVIVTFSNSMQNIHVFKERAVPVVNYSSSKLHVS